MWISFCRDDDWNRQYYNLLNAMRFEKWGKYLCIPGKCISLSADPLADPAKEVHGIVYDDFLPEMAAIFHEIQVEGVLLVGRL